MSKRKRSIEALVNEPSQHTGDEIQFYTLDNAGRLGRRDELAENVFQLCQTLNNAFPDALEVVDAFIQLGVGNRIPAKGKGKKND